MEPDAPDPERLARLLAQAEHRVSRALARRLADAGVTVPQWRVLGLLADGASHSMTELADTALLAPPSLTRLVDGMVAAALAARATDPGDRRRVLVRATRRGRALHARLARRVADAREEILAAPGQETVEALAALLARLASRR